MDTDEEFEYRRDKELEEMYKDYTERYIHLLEEGRPNCDNFVLVGNGGLITSNYMYSGETGGNMRVLF